jgi:hypothetical protein
MHLFHQLITISVKECISVSLKYLRGLNTSVSLQVGDSYVPLSQFAAGKVSDLN